MSEKQHWYDRSGKPVYTLTGKNGKERNTTLRDARPLQLVPSVSGVLNMEASPALTEYKINQVLNAVEEYNPPSYKLDMSEDIYNARIADWRRTIRAKAQQHSQKAAARGTELHDALEQYFLTKQMTNHWNFVEPVINFLEKQFKDVNWIPEQSFTSKLGYGGKVDMHCKCGIVLDFKTKDTDDVKKMIAYDGHHMQTAAYAAGLNMPKAKRFNLFISTKKPGLINLTESKNMERDWGMFESLLNFWKLKHNYDASF